MITEKERENYTDFQTRLSRLGGLSIAQTEMTSNNERNGKINMDYLLILNN